MSWQCISAPAERKVAGVFGENKLPPVCANLFGQEAGAYTDSHIAANGMRGAMQNGVATTLPILDSAITAVEVLGCAKSGGTTSRHFSRT